MSRGRASSNLAVALVVAAAAPLLLAPKCFEYQEPPAPDTGPVVDSGMDAPMDSAPPDTAPDTTPDTIVPIDTSVPPTPTPEGMIEVACLARRCDAGSAIRYWSDDWGLYDVERTITFRDPDASTSTFEVTDETGAPSDLVFEIARPVTLHVVAPGDGTVTAAHDFTASQFFRSVAFRDVVTVSGDYKAPTLDAVLPVHEAGTEHRATVRFVPIEAGTYTAYSSQGVTDGQRYAEIVEGTVTPDLTTGDADQGMTIEIEVAAGDDPLTVFQAVSPDRPDGLDSDPRRDAADPVWDAASVTTIGVLAQEGLDPMTGETRFTFDWTTRVLTRNTGIVLEVENEPGNRFDHDFTALGMLSDSVVRAAEDAHAEVRAPYFSGASITPGDRIRLYLVPTVAREYQTYCQIGVSHADNGAPDLTTGHAGAGMQDVITVVP